jgi:hypothetical protein
MQKSIWMVLIQMRIQCRHVDERRMDQNGSSPPCGKVVQKRAQMELQPNLRPQVSPQSMLGILLKTFSVSERQQPPSISYMFEMILISALDDQTIWTPGSQYESQTQEIQNF